MRTPILMIAIGMTAAAAAAQPAEAPVQKAAQSADRPAAAVTPAAATEEQTPATQPRQSDADSTKPVRHARVTTCRCGEQDPSR